MSVNEFKGIKITLKLKSNGTTTQDIYLSDRPVLNDTNVGQWIPILESATVGQVLSDYIPQDGSGTIIINNSMASIAEQLRFSDWLEDYAIIGQPVEFYIANNAIASDNFTAGLIQVWEDVIQSYTVSGNKITLGLKSNVLPQHVITYEIDKTLSPYAPASSIGKHLPIVFTNASDFVECEAIPIGSVSNGFCEFAYATTFGKTGGAPDSKFQNGGIQSYYAKNYKGQYVEVKDSGASQVYEWGADSPSNDYLEAHEGEFASRINYDTSNTYICDGIRIKFRGNTANTAITFSGEITIRIYERRKISGKPQKQSIIEASVNKETFETQLETDAEFNIDFAFEKLLVMSHANGYFVSISVSDVEANGTVRIVTQDETGYRIQYRNHPDRRSTTAWKRGDDAAGVDQETDKTFVMKFFALALSDEADGDVDNINQRGLNFSYFTVSAGYHLEVDPDYSDLLELDMIVKVKGIQDDAAGSITGSAYFTLFAANQICILLDYEWSGTAWVRQNKYDSTFASATHLNVDTVGSTYYRKLGGRTSGRVRVDQLLQSICQQLQLRICALNGTARKWGLYVTGAAITASDTLYDDDFKTISINATEQGAIVNDLLITFDERLMDVDLLNDKDGRGFAQNLRYYYDDGGVGEAISDESFLIYGARELRNNKYSLLNDLTSAQNVGKIILRTHDQANEFITIELPYYENRTLKAMDTLNLRTPKLYDLDGTTHNNNFNPLAKTNTFTNNSGTVIRAKSYKVQIINYQLVFDKNSMALYRLTCKLLTSANDPT